MKILIIAEIDLETGEYVLTFKNKSNPGVGMDLKRIQHALKLVVGDFEADKAQKTEPFVGLA